LLWRLWLIGTYLSIPISRGRRHPWREYAPYRGPINILVPWIARKRRRSEL
jgi:hypothetical protein